MDLSIIIPVYNTNVNVLKRCIDSILKLQDIKYEIILVNDGSCKTSEKEYNVLISKLKINQIKYICKENGGVSSARNIGIKNSKGKYIMFVDSDDTISADKIINKHFQTNADIILYNKIIIKKDKKYIVKEIDQAVGGVEVKYAIEQFVKNDKFHTPCAKLIKKSFIKKYDIDFDTNIIHGEDAIFNLEILENIPTIYYTNNNMYEYYYDYGTAENRWKKNPKKMIDNVKHLHDLKEQTIEKWNLEENTKLKSNLYNKYIKTMFTASMILDKKQYRENLNEITKIIKNIEIKKYKLNFSERIKYVLIKNNSWNIISILEKLRKHYLKYK